MCTQQIFDDNKATTHAKPWLLTPSTTRSPRPVSSTMQNQATLLFLAVVLRSTVLACAGTSWIDVNVGVGTTGSSRALAKMERYLGPKPSCCCEFGQFTLKQMKCRGIRDRCCEAVQHPDVHSADSGLHVLCLGFARPLC